MQQNNKLIKWLTYLMFMMFAMTTDSVGEIIPIVMSQFKLSMTEAGMLHYGPMIAIALAGILLGFLADKIGRKNTILIGLLLFTINSFLFAFGESFYYYLTLLLISGTAIGIFKTGSIALIGDITHSNKEHTSTMNMVEGFFGVGAIIGPFLVAYFLSKGMDWKNLYFVAALLSAILMITAFFIQYPKSKTQTKEKANLKSTFKSLKDPFTLAFSVGAFLYVSVEAAIYVWMPTLLKDYTGSLVLIATYSLSIFFILRAGGRFLGAWLLMKFHWSTILALFTFLILLFFGISVFANAGAKVILLPLTGLFMSVIYPTINSKGLSCSPKEKHGSVAGIILFFTAAGAAIGPLIMGAVSDYYQSPLNGFMVATIFAFFLFAMALLNWIYKPTNARLKENV